MTYSDDGKASWSLAAYGHADASITIDDADNDSTYVVGVRALNGGGGSGWRNSAPAGPYTPPPTLPASDDPVTGQSTSLTATHLTVTTTVLDTLGVGGAWYYRANTGPHAGDCWRAGHADKIGIEGLSAQTTYTYAGYLTSGCSNQFGQATFTTLASLAEDLVVSNLAADSLTITPGGDWSGPWYYRWSSSLHDLDSAICLGPATGGVDVTGLIPDQPVYLKMYNAGCNDTPPLAYVRADTPYPAYSVAFSSTGATFTQRGWSGDWWYSRAAPSGDNTCHAVAAGTNSVALTGLTLGGTYSYDAFRNSNCAENYKMHATNENAITFTVPELSVEPGSTSAALTVSDWTGPWWYRAVGIYSPSTGNFVTYTGQPCRGPAQGASAALTGLVSGYEYGFKAYDNYADCAEDYTYTNFNATSTRAAGALGAAPVKATTLVPSLTADNVTGTSARLNLSNWTASDPDWHYKANKGPHTSCSTSGAAGTSTDVTGLTANTSYDYTVHSAGGCHYSTVVARVQFTTTVRLSVTADIWRLGTLAVSNWTGDWWHDDGGQGIGCTKVDAPATQKAVSFSYDGGVTYFYKAYGKAGCADADLIAAAAPFTSPPKPYLTADYIGAGTATVRIHNWDRQWWYRHNTGSLSACTGPIAAGVNTVTYSSPAGKPIFGAYQDGNCSHHLDLATLQVYIPNKVVGNIGATSTTVASGIVGRAGSFGVVERANSFTTSAAGELQNVTLALRVRMGEPGNISVAVHNADTNGKPGSKIATLKITTIAGNSPPKAGEYIYRCDTDCDLEANTTYFVVVSAPGVPASGVHGFGWRFTSADSESGAGGWTIGDVSHLSIDGGAWTQDAKGRALRFKVHAQ